MPRVPAGTALAFPGQGGDWRATIAALEAHPDHELVRTLARRLGSSDWRSLDGLDTRVAQPAIYVAGLVRSGDLVAELAIGHSLGEITAAAWAAAAAPTDGLDLVVLRAELGHRAQLVRPGAMTAVNRWTSDAVLDLAAEGVDEGHGHLGIAVRNSPTQIVLSGDVAAVDEVTARANERGAVARRLPIDGAYHSPLMAPFVADLRDALHEAMVHDPRVPVLSSTSQAAMATAAELVDGIARSLVDPVDWPATVAAARRRGVDRALEAGPGDTLSRLARFAPELAIVAP